MTSENIKKPDITVAEAGRLGGEKTKEKHGPEYYRELGRKSAQKAKHKKAI